MDNLIEQNPRDFLIVMRNQNLSLERERKIRERAVEKERKIMDQAINAEASYSRTLEMFSRQFLLDDVFNTLSELQKKELDKLCASFCRRRIFFNSLPFLGSLGAIIYLSFLNPTDLLFLFPWVVASFISLVGMAKYCENKHKVFFLDQISFLLSRRKIKMADKLKDAT